MIVRVQGDDADPDEEGTADDAEEGLLRKKGKGES